MTCTTAFARLTLLGVIMLAVGLVFSAAEERDAAGKPEGMQWRLIGPFRAGRVAAVSGVPGSGTDFFFGAVDGGIWKTESAGTVWTPIFDGQPVASIGALAVAVSDPKVIYAGTGEPDIRSDLAMGNGVYRSDDGGQSWRHVGLDDTRQISRILVSPTDPKTVYVGALGHAYGPNAERGVYRSTDSGEHWKRVLDRGPDVGIADVAMAAGKPNVLFAATWNARRPPWSTYAPISGPGNGLYRSTDGGDSWTEIHAQGLPGEDWGRVGVAVSTDGRRVYAALSGKDHAGIYRSDDGGDQWALLNADDRLTSRAWYFNSLAIDPQNADVLYVPNVALYRTEDGGKTFGIVRGAPGGDDYHQIWVDPKNSAHLMLGVDQGATVSLDRGKTWTSWYNQPTAQLYHVTTDTNFPYFVYGAQQDSGAIAVASRTDHGNITGRDWFQPTGSESGTIAIDPMDQNIIYVSGTYGSVQRFDRRTSLSQTITPWPLGSFALEISKRKYRAPWTPALAFSQADKRSLYLGTQYVMKTVDGGLHWKEISPDLTGAVKGTSAKGEVGVRDAKELGFGVVYTIAPSPLKAEQIWAGSDTGLVHLTKNGGATWEDVTPKGVTPWSKIALIEASHFDAAVAYAVVDRHRLDDNKPYLYVTKDYGKTWSLRVDGIAPGAFLNAVREDPKQHDLLYAATELGMYWSSDRGEHWTSLQRNLPVTSVRDIDVHGDDLVIATHGRSFWVLDDIAPLRQRAEAQRAKAAFLYAPATAVRVDNDSFLGTPLPPEEPQAKNPLDGAVIDYLLKAPAKQVHLRIFDSEHKLLWQFSSGETPKGWPRTLPIAERWFPAPQLLVKSEGEHRFVWDLAAGGSGMETGDDDEDDAGAPPGPHVTPGVYAVELDVDGKVFRQSLTVTMDPRDKASVSDLEAQFRMGQDVYTDAQRSRKALAEIQSVTSELKKLQETETDLSSAVAAALARVAEIGAGGASSNEDRLSLAATSSGLGAVLRVVESGHRAAPASSLEAHALLKKSADERIGAWTEFKAKDLRQLNQRLRGAGRPPVELGASDAAVSFSRTR